MEDEIETVILREGRYIIKVDKCNYILYELKKIRTGKNKGEERESVMGYHTSLSHAINSISEDMLKRKLKTNKDKTFDGILGTIEKHVELIERKFGGKLNDK